MEQSTANSGIAMGRGRRGVMGGFTLFEMVLVLLVIGIAAAAIVPAVGNNIRSPKLRTAANVLASDIEFCASECIAQPNAPRAINFDTTGNKYTVVDSNDGTAIKHPMDGQSYVNDFATGRNSQLSGVGITGLVMGSETLSSLTFSAYGRPTITADLVITLTYNNQTLQVTVKNGTGDVVISGG
jgi:prepilin-type N-terminal cleavage/methylation domain-containing protein